MMRSLLAFMCLLTVACGATPSTSRELVPTERAAQPAMQAACDGPMAVQVLGSGGPIAIEGRASSGYLVWLDGHARFLVDAGPGVMLRFGESAANADDLEAVFISHLHVDHSADLVAFLKSTSFGQRRDSLPLYGPSGSDRFPSIREFLQRELGSGGAYAYLGGFITDGQPYRLAVRELDVSASIISAFGRSERQVRAVGVPHGPVPALSYEFQVGQRRLVFMGDQRADDERYLTMIQGADVLVAHMAIPERSPGIAATLHAPPGRLGRVAAEANVGMMVISHLMPRSLEDLDANLAAIRAHYGGPVMVASDGECFDVGVPDVGVPDVRDVTSKP